MIKVLFVCLGNICRSPMAEFVFKDMVKKEKLENKFLISSSATSTWEQGNPVYYDTKKILNDNGIFDGIEEKTSKTLTKEDFSFDYIIAMDSKNINDILNFKKMYKPITNKNQEIKLLLEYANKKDSIADPWYFGDFDTTYYDVLEGCDALFKYIKEKHKL